MSGVATATSIPTELRERAQWVVWRYEMREGKRTKIPYCATQPHVGASSTDPRSWATFEQALAVEGFNGIGYVFSPEDPYTGLDFDACIDEDGEVHPAVAEIIGKLASYTERTPSDRGFHVIIKAELRTTRYRTSSCPWPGGFEVYDRRRYFTVTGRGRGVIADRQRELDELVAEFLPKPKPAQSPRRTIGNGHAGDDTELLRRAFAARNGTKIQALYQGDTSEYGGDDSAADLALCSALAFWTGPDFDRIDALFRGSGLYREKWEREDYRQRTIETALRTRSEFFEWQPSRGNGRTATMTPVQNGAAPRAEASYKVAFDGDKLLLPELPAAGDLRGLCAWLTAAFNLNATQPITGGKRAGLHGPEGHVVLTRAEAPSIRFEPATKINTPAKLIETLSWQMTDTDGAVFALKGEHCRQIAYGVRMLCGVTESMTDEQETEAIVGTFMQSAEAVEGHTTYGTSGQKYEAALALRRTVDEVTGRAVGPYHYLIDSESDEMVITVSDLQEAARRHTGSSLQRGWLDARMETCGWTRITIAGYGEPGRDGRKTGPHARVFAHRGHLRPVDESEG